MRKRLSWAGALLMLAALQVKAHAAPVADNLKIVPGQHLGRVFLGDNKAAVHRRLGAPTKLFKSAGGLISELWRAKTADEDDFRNTLEVVYRRGVAVQIEATSTQFQMPSGLTARSDAINWIKTFGAARITRYRYSGDKPSQRYYDWTRRGLAIETQSGPGDVDFDEVQTIIVHRRGARVVPDRGGTLVR